MIAKQLTAKNYWGEIPDKWDLITIRQGFSLIGSGTTPPTGQTEFFNGSIPWVTTSELRENRILATEQKLTQLAIGTFSALKIFPEDTVLIAMYGATVGRVAILGIPACMNQAVCALAKPTHFTPEFASYALQVSKAFLLSLVSGGGQPNLNAEKITSHLIPCPPLSQQKRITNYLDRETQKIDALIAAKKRLLELLAEKRRSVITHAVTRGLTADVPMKNSGVKWIGDIPEDWKVVTLSFLGRVRTGVAKGRKLDNCKTVQVPYLRVANVQDGYLNLVDVADIEVLPEEIASYSLRKGDVLMNEGGDADKLGRGAVWDGLIDPCLHQNHVFAVRCHSVEPDWLATVTSSDYAKAFFESRAKQSTNLASISSTNLKELPVVLPPQKTQKQIVEKLSEILSQIDSLSNTTKRAIALLQERRTSLISTAVTGQLQIPD